MSGRLLGAPSHHTVLSLMFPASISALGLFLTEAPAGILVKDHPQLHYCPQANFAELALLHGLLQWSGPWWHGARSLWKWSSAMTHRSSVFWGMGRQASGDRHSFLEASIFTMQRQGRDCGPCGRTCGQQASLAIGQHCPAWAEVGHRVRDWDRIWCSPSGAVKRGKPLAQPWGIAAMRCWLFVGCWCQGHSPLCSYLWAFTVLL